MLLRVDAEQLDRAVVVVDYNNHYHKTVIGRQGLQFVGSTQGVAYT